MGPFDDIQSVFADILGDPAQQQQEELVQNVGLFRNGLAGALGSALTRSGREIRGKLHSTGLADVRTQDQRFRAEVNAINPSDPDAESKYMEAAKKYAPGKVPQLAAALRRRQLQEEERGFRRAAEERAESAEQRAVNADQRASDMHTRQMRQAELRNELTGLQVEDMRQNSESQQQAREYLKNSAYAQRQSAQYQDAIDGLPPQALFAEMTKAMGFDSTVGRSLTAALNSLLDEDDPLREFIPDLSVEQKFQIVNAERAEQKPNWQVVTDRTGTLLIDTNNINNRVRLTASAPTIEPARAPTQNAINGMIEQFEGADQDKMVRDAFGVDNLDPETMSTIFTTVQQDIQAAGGAGTVSQVQAEILRRSIEASAVTEEEVDELASTLFPATSGM